MPPISEEDENWVKLNFPEYFPNGVPAASPSRSADAASVVSSPSEAEPQGEPAAADLPVLPPFPCDRWEEKEDYWVREHRVARKALFHPGDALGGLTSLPSCGLA